MKEKVLELIKKINEQYSSELYKYKEDIEEEYNGTLKINLFGMDEVEFLIRSELFKDIKYSIKISYYDSISFLKNEENFNYQLSFCNEEFSKPFYEELLDVLNSIDLYCLDLQEKNQNNLRKKNNEFLKNILENKKE